MVKGSAGILARRVCLPMGFSTKIKFAATLASSWDLRLRDKKPGYPPSPLPLWNHHVSKKFLAKSG
jgi:hypothetical protein